jgi:hypothetical protein
VTRNRRPTKPTHMSDGGISRESRFGLHGLVSPDDMDLQLQIDDIARSIKLPNIIIHPSEAVYYKEWCSLNGVNLSPLYRRGIKSLSIRYINGCIDLSPLTDVSTLDVTLYEHPLEREGYGPEVVFPESDRLEEVVLHGAVEHDRETLARLTNLKRVTLHNPRDTDLSWLSDSSSIEWIQAYFRLPKSLVLPAIPTLERLLLISWKARDPYSLREIDLSPLRVCEDLREIRILKQRISDIDLSPLSGCRKLEVLTIGGCGIQTVDLSPLRSKALKRVVLHNNKLHSVTFPDSFEPEHVDLGTNWLEEVDLKPIASSSLKELCLGPNYFADIDLSPLSACPSLESLEVEHTRLDSIDLTPLTGLKHLRVFKTASSFMNWINVTPLLSCPSLEEVKLGKLRPEADRKMVDEILSPKLKKIKKKIEWMDGKYLS